MMAASLECHRTVGRNDGSISKGVEGHANCTRVARTLSSGPHAVISNNLEKSMGLSSLILRLKSSCRISHEIRYRI